MYFKSEHRHLEETPVLAAFGSAFIFDSIFPFIFVFPSISIFTVISTFTFIFPFLSIVLVFFLLPFAFVLIFPFVFIVIFFIFLPFLFSVFLASTFTCFHIISTTPPPFFAASQFPPSPSFIASTSTFSSYNPVYPPLQNLPFFHSLFPASALNSTRILTPTTPFSLFYGEAQHYLFRGK